MSGAGFGTDQGRARGRVRAALRWSVRALAVFFVWTASLGVALVVYEFTWSQWISDRERPVLSEMERLQNEVRNLEIAAAKLKEFTAQVEYQQQRMDVLRQMLPEEKDARGVERAVAALATQGGVTVVSSTSGAPQRLDFYARRPLELELRGPLPGLLALPRRIEMSSMGVFLPPIPALAEGRASAGGAGLIHVRGLHVERDGASYRGRLIGFTYSAVAETGSR